jgi:putative tricarboxylic transport membrane protein
MRRTFCAGDNMRRDTFLKSLLALGTTAAWPLAASASANLKMMIPANPGGGWDTTGRALGKALQDAGAASSVTFDNKGGAAGALGLAQFLGSKGDPNALMVMGAVMLGGLITSKSPLKLEQATPLARLTTEYNVFVLPESSPLKTMKDVVDQLKKDPGSVKWGGGSRGSTEHIAAAMIAQAAGVDPSKINYVAFRGGGEAIAAILGGNVTVGGSGYSEFQQYIDAGKMRPIGVTSAQRQRGINVPTLKEQGIDVEIGNWRGVYGAPGISAEQRKALVDMIVKATRSKTWAEALEKNGWTPALITGDEFAQFVDRDFAALRATMARAGMV